MSLDAATHTSYSTRSSMRAELWKSTEARGFVDLLAVSRSGIASGSHGDGVSSRPTPDDGGRGPREQGRWTRRERGWFASSSGGFATIPPPAKSIQHPVISLDVLSYGKRSSRSGRPRTREGRPACGSFHFAVPSAELVRSRTFISARTFKCTGIRRERRPRGVILGWQRPRSGWCDRLATTIM